MKGVTAEQLLHSVGKFEAMRHMVVRLDRSGQFAELSAVLTSILSSELTLSHSNGDVKECLKLITALAIDDIAKNIEAYKATNASTSARTQSSDFVYAIDYALLDYKEASRPKTKPQIQKKREAPLSLQSSPAALRIKSASTCQLPASVLRSLHSSPSRETEDLKTISDFAFPAPSAVFPRSPRKTLEVRELSPGPAHYRPNLDSVKEKHASVLIPRSGKRYDYYVPETPGPAFYTPLRAFLAKRLGKI